MIDLTTLIAFSAAALVLLLIPGPGILYLLARSISQGRKAGFISSLGLSAGSLIHVLSATLGISALLATSASAFNIIKLIGSVYLIYLGIQTILSNTPAVDGTPIKPVPFKRLFIDGLVVSVFNPKIAIFFIAFLPQFVNPEVGDTTAQFLTLGLVFVVIATLVDFTFACVSGTFHKSLVDALETSSVPRYLTGSVYIGLGLGTAFVDQPVK